MKLYFRNSVGEDRVIAECDTLEEVNRQINRFLSDHDYTSYYTRMWYGTVNKDTAPEKRLIYDVGSHDEFFELYMTQEEMGKLPEHMKGLITQNG